MRASLDVTENSSLEAAGRTRLELVHRPPGVLPPAIVEGKAALSPHHHLAPADHGLDGFLLFVQSPRTAAGLSIHARAAAVLGLALRKEIALLPIAAEKIPRLGAVDVREGDSAAREGCAGDPVGEVVNQEFLRRGKEPAYTDVRVHNNISVLGDPATQTGIQRRGGGGIESAMGLQVDFEEYAAKAKTLPVNTTNKSKLILYGVLSIKVKIMLDWDPKGKQGPMTPLSDQITIHAPKGGRGVTFQKNLNATTFAKGIRITFLLHKLPACNKTKHQRGLQHFRGCQAGIVHALHCTAPWPVDDDSAALGIVVGTVMVSSDIKKASYSASLVTAIEELGGGMVSSDIKKVSSSSRLFLND
ncbi:hypothetical protein C4D60_Mb01t11510 [Musa balbisiana]|uniref:Uncharacterized protein n=1 Tax=Musa balbisiana TaxID=52838 RepID=A0A4S8JLI6_MUSBA|nr:hypothetical protein C4D60_Mb01t11510 [Musa balbisiana]